MSKICAKCKQEKPLTAEYFFKQSNNKDGFEGQCKQCRKEYKKKWKENNREHVREVDKIWYEKNKERRSEYNKQWDKDNAEHRKRLRREWQKENHKYNPEYPKQWKLKNKDKIKAWSKKWRENNSDKIRRDKQKRKALLKKLPSQLSVEQWNIVLNYFNNECAYCGISEEEHLEKYGQRLHQEHFAPLVYGGEYTHNNIITSCRSCNSSKSNKDFFKWYPTYKHYNKQREKFILEYLGYTKNTQQLSIL